MHVWKSFGLTFVFILGCTVSLYSTEETCAWSAWQFPPKLVDGAYPHHYRPDRTIDAEHLTIAIKVFMQERAIEGKATYRFTPIHDRVKQIRFDAVEMNITDVHCSAVVGMTWSYMDNQLYITFDRALPVEQTELGITYSASMTDRSFSGLGDGDASMFFADTQQRVPPVYNQMHTLDEPFGAANWFPCVDYPDDTTVTELDATVPKEFKTLSNGALAESVENGDWRTDRWKQKRPQAIYLISLVVGDYAIVCDEWKGIPVEYYVEPDKVDDARPSLGNTVDMIDFYSSYLDYPYPFEKYAQVHVRNFRAGGMEHTTATTLHEWAIIDKEARLDHDSDGLVAHELAHQWFGDSVTCKNWGHLWLNESFATFFDALWHEHAKGEDAYLHELWNNMNSYFGEARRYTRSIVTNEFAKPGEMFDSHSYPKGSMVLHMLRNELGGDLFRKSLHRYLVDNAPGVVDTTDLQDAIEAATGRPMDRFFEQWIYGPGHPKVTIKHEWLSGFKQLKLTVEQTQDMEEGRPAFAFPLQVRVHTGSGTIDRTFAISRKKETLYLDCNEQPLGIEVDPYLHALMELEYKKSEAMSIYELQHGSTIVSRTRALESLKDHKSKDAVAAITEAMMKDAFWDIQAKAAGILGGLGTDEALQALLGACEHPDPKVRASVVQALGKFHEKSEVYKALKERFENDKSISVIAASARSLARTKAPNAYSILRKAIGRKSWRHIIHFAVIDSLVDLKEVRVFSSLKKFAEPGHRINVRTNALRNMGRLAKETEKNESQAMKILTGYLHSPSEQLRRAAVQGLGSLEDEDAIDALRTVANDDKDSNVREAADKAIRDIRNVSSELNKKNAKRIDDLEKGQKKLLERIDDLEALLKKAVAKDEDEDESGNGDH